MHATPYLNFDGTCSEAFDFYAEVLGGKIEFKQTFGESPMGAETPPQMKDWIMHATLVAGDIRLMASDAPPDRYEKPQGIYISLHVDDASEAERIFGRFEEGGTVTMPLEKTFWAERFGMVVDRFGTPWMVNVEGEEPVS